MIVFTGGGTAGHVFPAFPVMERLQRAGLRVCWLGSARGMERELIAAAGIRYFGVPAGKLRRYFSFSNVIDGFYFLAGVVVCLFLLVRLRPVLLVSKGGFVSVAPVAAAMLLRIPRITHESDCTLGLATRLNVLLGARILVSYRQTLALLKSSVRERAVLTGNPVRDDVLSGDVRKGRALAGMSDSETRPLVLVAGGSLGAQRINRIIDDLLEEILGFAVVVHQRGQDMDGVSARPGYVFANFFHEEFPHLLAAADLVIGRAGAGFVWELAATGTPGILIPLKSGSRGDQLVNADMAAAAGFVFVLDEDEALTGLMELLRGFVRNEEMRCAMVGKAATYQAAAAAGKFAEVVRGMSDAG